MKREKRPSYLKWIRTLPCVVCGDDVTTEAAHLRMGVPWVLKPITGMGVKPDDVWTLPLCHGHHELQHKVGEKVFWRSWLQPRPEEMCLALWRVQFDRQQACDLISIWNVPGGCE